MARIWWAAVRPNTWRLGVEEDGPNLVGGGVAGRSGVRSRGGWPGSGGRRCGRAEAEEDGRIRWGGGAQIRWVAARPGVQGSEAEEDGPDPVGVRKSGGRWHGQTSEAALRSGRGGRGWTLGGGRVGARMQTRWQVQASHVGRWRTGVARHKGEGLGLGMLVGG